jgi:hypothetical protein
LIAAVVDYGLDDWLWTVGGARPRCDQHSARRLTLGLEPHFCHPDVERLLSAPDDVPPAYFGQDSLDPPDVLRARHFDPQLLLSHARTFSRRPVTT